MSETLLPDYYFRIRETGAQVFKVDHENRHRRIEMAPIAVVNIRNGNVKATGSTKLTDADNTAISAWIEERKALIAARDWDHVMQTVDHLNTTAQWAQSQASDAELDTITDALLIAMHDLRTVLVRKKADRV